MRYAWAAILVAACGHEPPPAAPETPLTITPPCEYGYMAVKYASGEEGAGHALFDQAEAESDAGHPLDAAHDFMACARAFAALSTDTAVYDAHVCYYDAIYAYAKAGAFAREGKAALQAAAAEDAKNASYIQEQLLHPPDDCAAK